MVNTAHKNRHAETHENQGGIEIFIVFLHVVGVVFHRFSFVHGVEIKPGVVVLNWLEEHPQGLLDAIWSQLAAPCDRFSKTHHRGSTLTGSVFPSPLISISVHGG